MNLLRIITGLLVFCAVTTAIARSQTHAPAAGSPAVTGAVEGRVLGITRTGDLKPARMPTIYLLYKGQGEHLEANSADAHYQIASLGALQNRLNHPCADDEDLRCRESLLDTDGSLIDTAQWALDNKKTKQVLTSSGDEEGNFRIAKVPIGRYRIVARGQAGASDAYWESIIVVKAGTATSAKLTSPGKSCLHAE